MDGTKACKQRVLPCTLDKATQDLVSLIFSNDMFRDAMQTMNIGKRCWAESVCGQGVQLGRWPGHKCWWERGSCMPGAQVCLS